MSISKEDLSSTEKLLKVIRGSGHVADSESRGFSQPGFFSKMRRQWFAGSTGDILGVEISRDTISLVRTTASRAGREIVHASSDPIPPGLSPDHPEFIGFLKSRILQTGAAPRKTDIWACLPAARGEIWSVRVPRIRKGLSNAAYWSARKEKAFDEAETVFDYHITGEITENGSRKLLAEVCTVPARDVNLYKKVFSGAGFSLKGITLPAFAIKNLFVSGLAGLGRDVCAVLCIGEESSSIDIHGEGRILFSRVIRTGRDSIVDSLAMASGQAHEYDSEIAFDPDPDALAPEGNEANETRSQPQAPLSRKAAQQILNAFDASALENGAVFSSKAFFALMEPALERLARQLERTISHSVNVLHHPSPSKLYICGHISFLKEIADFFGEQLGIQTEALDILGSSVSRVSPDAVLRDSGRRLSLASAVGLAMPVMETANFLHTAFDRDREKTAMRSTNAVAAGCALLFIFTAGYWWYTLNEQERARRETVRLEEQLHASTPNTTLETITQMAGAYKQQQRVLADYSRKLHGLAVIGEIQRITPENIQMLNMTLDANPPKSDARTERRQTLLLEGIIRQNAVGFDAVLAGYIRQLRQSPMIREVAIRRSTIDSFAEGEEVYRFILHIDLDKV